MKISDILRHETLWETRRQDRLETEKAFENFSGVIDAVELHIPYYRHECLERIAQKAQEATCPRMFISMGDAVNLDMFSLFFSDGYPSDNVKPRDEIEKLIKIIRRLSEYYEHMIFLVSNHEERIIKNLRRKLGKGIAEEYEYFLKDFDQIFNQSGLNIIVVKSPFVQIGDAVFSHFENNSIVPGSVDRWSVQYLLPRIEKKWDVLFQAHTHCQSKIPIDRKMIIETGTIAVTMDYWRRGKMTGRGKLSTYGYARCEMMNGKAILDRCDFVPMGWEEYL